MHEKRERTLIRSDDQVDFFVKFSFSPFRPQLMSGSSEYDALVGGCCPGRVRLRVRVRRGVGRVSGEHGQGWVGVAVVVARKFDPDGPRVQPVGHDVPVDRRDYMRRAF